MGRVAAGPRSAGSRSGADSQDAPGGHGHPAHPAARGGGGRGHARGGPERRTRAPLPPGGGRKGRAWAREGRSLCARPGHRSLPAARGGGACAPDLGTTPSRRRAKGAGVGTRGAGPARGTRVQLPPRGARGRWARAREGRGLCAGPRAFSPGGARGVAAGSFSRGETKTRESRGAAVADAVQASSGLRGGSGGGAAGLGAGGRFPPSAVRVRAAFCFASSFLLTRTPISGEKISETEAGGREVLREPQPDPRNPG